MKKNDIEKVMAKNRFSDAVVLVQWRYIHLTLLSSKQKIS